MLAALRDPTYGRRNRAIALFLLAFIPLALGAVFLMWGPDAAILITALVLTGAIGTSLTAILSASGPAGGHGLAIQIQMRALATMERLERRSRRR